jgi:hypothetical protein
MCDPISAAVAIFGAATINQASEQRKAASMQADANEKATAAATKQADQADQANNRANGRQPDVMGLDAANAAGAKGGVSGTMLTGPQGVDPKTLLLGKTTLLGG